MLKSTSYIENHLMTSLSSKSLIITKYVKLETPAKLDYSKGLISAGLSLEKIDLSGFCCIQRLLISFKAFHLKLNFNSSDVFFFFFFFFQIKEDAETVIQNPFAWNQVRERERQTDRQTHTHTDCALSL